jgi:hypothetical protein
LELDRETILLKEFDLGTLGRRLALFSKIQRFQQEVKASRPVSKSGSQRSASLTSYSGRERSASGGTVLPKIPSLTATGGEARYSHDARGRTRAFSTSHNEHSTPPHTGDDSSKQETSPRPSAASIRSFGHSRRHSSIDYTLNPTSPTKAPVVNGGPVPGHTKTTSYDRSWTMSGTTVVADSQPSTGSGLAEQSPNIEGGFLAPPTPEYVTNANAVDLDRGYFSGNEAETRRFRNVLRKRDSSHSRAPSDSVSHHRLSGVFRHIRSGSTDSVTEAPTAHSPSFLQRAFSSKHSSSGLATPTKDQGSSPSIDTISTTPRVAASDTSSLDKPIPSPIKIKSSKPKPMGLRAISDAITNGEKALVESPQAMSATSKDGPFHSHRPDSSNQSMTSKSISFDDKKPIAVRPAKFATLPGAQHASRRKSKQETSAYVRGLEKKHPAEQIADSDYSGWMKKKSKKLGKWHPRLFVLRGRRLSYYYSEDDTEEKGLIDISFHRVLPANKDLVTGFHAAITGAGASPTSPSNSHLQTAAQTDATKSANSGSEGIFIFKLVPPRPGHAKGVSFTQPKVHFFAVNSLQEGRNWMAALMKATIERDDDKGISTTYKEKTISLSKARELQLRPKEFLLDTEAEGLGIKAEDFGDRPQEDDKKDIETGSKKDSIVEKLAVPAETSLETRLAAIAV